MFSFYARSIGCNLTSATFFSKQKDFGAAECVTGSRMFEGWSSQHACVDADGLHHKVIVNLHCCIGVKACHPPSIC